MAKIPSITVSEEFAELIRDFAASKRISVGNAVRQLVIASPALIEFAEKQGVKLDAGVREWGGQRNPKRDE